MVENIQFNTQLDNLGPCKITRLIGEKGWDSVKEMIVHECKVEYARQNKENIIMTAVLTAAAFTTVLAIAGIVSLCTGKKQKKQLKQFEVHTA